MSSVLPGYEYDIFISYRQKDNKYDGWVTEFVDHLKRELEATFKEDISIYFDENPSDGLLETHDVDASLKDKLRCLIFIPIISRTYCDPKSFAWEHEFRAFVEQASHDQFGIKIKLPSGNVASRVLPVRIYDLDVADFKLCESVLGGFLRPVDFIYKSAGVNRPLRADEDHPQDNMNKTYYRDQINKVANSIRETIGAIGQQYPEEERVPGGIIKPATAIRKKNKAPIIAGSIMVLALIILGILFIPKLFTTSEKPNDKSIAVLPFKLLGNEPDMQYQADGMMDAILMQLSRIRDLRVRDRTSIEQYRQTTKTMQTIGRELDVKYVLEGSFQKYGENVKLIVQLINAGKGSHIWANEYNKKWEEVFNVQSEVAQTIASEINVRLSPEEKKTIETPPTSNLTAYDFYLKGIDYAKRSSEEQDMRNAIRMFEKATEIDPVFSLAWVGLAGSYRSLYWWGYETGEKAFPLAKKYLDNALALSPGLKEVQVEEALYIYHISHDLRKSLELLEKLKSQYPNDGELVFYISAIYKRMGESDKALGKVVLAISLEPSNWRYWLEGAIISNILGHWNKAEEFCLKSFELNPSNSSTLWYLLSDYFSSGQIQKAREFLKNHEESFNSRDLRRCKALVAYFNRDFDKAIQFSDSLSEDPIIGQEYYYTKHLQLGLFYLAKQDLGNATIQFGMERDFLIRKIKESGEDGRLYHSLGIAYAGLAMKDHALEVESKAREIRASYKDVLNIRVSEWNLIGILVMVGEYDDAMNKLKDYMESFKDHSVESLKIDPLWDTVRNHPKFKEIINNPKYQTKF